MLRAAVAVCLAVGAYAPLPYNHIDNCVPAEASSLPNADFGMFLRNFVCEPSGWTTSAEAALVWSMYKNKTETDIALRKSRAVDELERLFRFVHDVNDQTNCHPNCQIHVWQRACNRLCPLLSVKGHCYVAELNIQRDPPKNAPLSELGTIYADCYAMSMANEPGVAGPFETVCAKIMGTDEWGVPHEDDNDASVGLKC